MNIEDLLSENEILKKENARLTQQIKQIRWDQQKLGYRIQELVNRWDSEQEEITD